MVLVKDAKKNVRFYPLQESLLTIRKERIGGEKLEVTKHTQRKNRENSSRVKWAIPIYTGMTLWKASWRRHCRT